MVSRWRLRKCVLCGAYTLRNDRCPHCGGPVRVPHPSKFSPEDRYGKYRRMMRRQLLASCRAPPTLRGAVGRNVESGEEGSGSQPATQGSEGYSTL